MTTDAHIDSDAPRRSGVPTIPQPSTSGRALVQHRPVDAVPGAHGADAGMDASKERMFTTVGPYDRAVIREEQEEPGWGHGVQAVIHVFKNK